MDITPDKFDFLIDKVKNLLKVGLDAFEVDKTKAAATISGLPICFEYGFNGATTTAYARPNIAAIKEYLTHVRQVWL